MNIEFTNWGGNGEREVSSVSGYVKYRMNNESDGLCETAISQSESAHACFSRLVEILFNKGIITAPEISLIVNQAWKNDELKETPKEATFNY